MTQEQIEAEADRAWDAWWRGLTRLGDPMRRPHLAREAFDAGYRIAVATHGEEQSK